MDKRGEELGFKLSVACTDLGRGGEVQIFEAGNKNMRSAALRVYRIEGQDSGNESSRI